MREIIINPSLNLWLKTKPKKLSFLPFYFLVRFNKESRGGEKLNYVTP